MVFNNLLTKWLIVTNPLLQHLTIKTKKIMNVEGIISSVKKEKYLIISEVELNELLSNSILLIEANTYISDKIRLLEYKKDLLIQEKSTKDEYLVRLMKTKKEAEELIKERLNIYNRMWDGCGCRVNYYE